MTVIFIDIFIDITCYIHLDKGAAVIFFMVSEQILTLNSVNILLGRIVSIRMTRAENIFCQNTKRERIIVRQGKTMPGQCRSEEHTSELQSRGHLVCRLLLEK